jgi:hypothetical protein
MAAEIRTRATAVVFTEHNLAGALKVSMTTRAGILQVWDK